MRSKIILKIFILYLRIHYGYEAPRLVNELMIPGLIPSLVASTCEIYWNFISHVISRVMTKTEKDGNYTKLVESEKF